ncbi:peptidoglycan-binding protein [Streptomyces albicerus]|uniref:peptidoglycan-binding protein n=1 Tax=Streptomyces albicerus TaxID=2569859 RepID=UPI00124B4A19
MAVDCAFGPATRDALEYAQRQEGTTVDGQYGEQGFKNLRWARYTQDGTRNDCASDSF